MAYLVIARGAGSRTKSSWSVDAIERHTGMGRPRAKAAITSLIGAGLLTLERGGTRPQYGIVPAHLLPQAILSPDERRVFDLADSIRLKRGDIDIALQLVSRGLLKKEGYVQYSRDGRAADILSDKPVEVWLPNAIVNGAADEVSPLALLRQMQDLRRLQLFVALYDSHDFPTGGGVSRSVLYQKHPVSKVSERGAFTIWAFEDASTTSSAGGSPLSKPFMIGKRDENGSDVGVPDFWQALRCFEACGLLTFIPHVFESENPDAEVLHAYPIEDAGSEPWERDVAKAAHAAGIVCIPEGQQQWAAQLGRNLLVQPSHIAGLAVIGIARLRYRPRTGMTSIRRSLSAADSGLTGSVYPRVRDARRRPAADAIEKIQDWVFTPAE